MTNHTRQLSMHPWYDVGRPIAISLGLFCVLNFCWNVLLPSFGFYHTQSAPVILRRQGGIYLISSLVALPFLASAGVAFGLYHYTHEERFHEFAPMLIPVMWLNLACFTVTRNFTLTFIVHNVVAAIGFMQSQYADKPPEDMNPALYYDPLTVSA